MDHATALAAQLQAFRRRILWLFCERWICWGVAGAGVVGLVLLLIDLCTIWYVTPLELTIVCLLGALVGAGLAYVRRPDALSIALTVERRCALQERASTAVALLADPQAHPEFRTLVTDDAVAHLQGLDPKALFPRIFARPYRAALAVWMAVLLGCLLPNLPWFYSPMARAERAAVHDAGVTLHETAKKLDEHDALRHDPEIQQLVRRLRKLAVEMEKNRLPKKEAMKRWNKLRDEMEHLQQAKVRDDVEQAQKELQNAAAQAQAALNSRSEAEKAAAQQAKARLAAGLSKQQLTPQERNALEREEAMQALQRALAAGNMAAATDALRRLGVPMKNGALSPQAQQALSQAMRHMANAAQRNGSSASSQAMRNAAGQLQQGTSQGQQQAGNSMSNMPGGNGGQSDAGDMLNQAMGNMENARRAMADNQSGNNRGNGNGNGKGGQNGNGNGRNGGRGGGSGGKKGSGGGGTGRHPNATGGNNGAGHDSKPNEDPNPNFYGTHDGDPAYVAGGGQQSLHHGLRNGYGVGEHPLPAGDPGVSTVDVRGGDGGGRTGVPYTEVYSDYHKGAEHAIEAEQVPPSYTQRVKDYFAQLDPGAH